MNFQNMKGLFTKQRRKVKYTVISAGIIISITVGILLFEGTKKTVAVTIDGKVQHVRTHADNVKELLQDLNIQYRNHDYLSPAADTKIRDHLKIVWEPAKKVIIKVDGKKQTVWTTAKTVNELLRQIELDLQKHDEINIPLQTLISNKLEIEIQKAFEVALNDGGKVRKVWSTSTTVADFLKQQGIKLNEFDRVEPSLDQILKNDSKVKVIRVEKVTDVVEEPINFAVVTKKDDSLLSGKEKIVQQGKTGKIQKKYEVVLENGKQVAKKLISEKVIEKPRDKIVAVGTKKIVQTASRGYSSNSKEFYVTATAFTANCNGCTGKTATGIDLRANPNIKIIAVDPRFIPLGTKVYVEGYGYAIAADIGGSIKGNKIDVFFPSKQQAYRWGVKKVKIKILK